MIEFEAFSYRYPEALRPALNSLTLNISRGQATLIMGDSGSGKSTLLRAINGLVPNYYGGHAQGRISVGGRSLAGLRPAAIAARVGTVFQEPRSRFVTGSVEDEIVFSLEMAGWQGSVIQRELPGIVERLQLGPLMRRPLQKISGGEQQKAALAVAMARRPQVLLLDEPTSQLDSDSASALIDWAGDLAAQEGATMVVAEHRYEGWIEMMEQLVFLEEGQRIETSEPGDSPAEIVQPSLKHTIPGYSSELHLETRALKFSYEIQAVLTGVDFAVKRGEWVGLIGHNGSGKTTLLRCLMGLEHPREGRILLNGVSVEDKPVSTLARSMAFVPQWPSQLLFSRTVRDELRATLETHNDYIGALPKLEEALAQFDLEPLADRYPRDLSAGERQRTALAALMIGQPQIVLLDEPTLGMDARHQRQLAKYLAAIGERGVSIVVATHDHEFIARHADRFVELAQGQVLREGPADQLLASTGVVTLDTPKNL